MKNSQGVSTLCTAPFYLRRAHQLHGLRCRMNNILISNRNLVIPKDLQALISDRNTILCRFGQMGVGESFIVFPVLPHFLTKLSTAVTTMPSTRSAQDTQTRPFMLPHKRCHLCWIGCTTFIQSFIPVCQINGNFRNLKLIGGTDSIYKAYFLGLCKGISPPKYGLIWYSTSILGSWNSHWSNDTCSETTEEPPKSHGQSTLRWRCKAPCGVHHRSKLLRCVWGPNSVCISLFFLRWISIENPTATRFPSKICLCSLGICGIAAKILLCPIVSYVFFIVFFHFFHLFSDVRFHVRDTYGNRMLDDFHSQLLVSHGVRQLRPTRSLRPSLRGSRRGCFWSGALEWVFHRNFSREKKPGIRGTDTLNISKSWLRNDLDSYIILYLYIYYWYYNVYCYYILFTWFFFACHSMNFVSAVRISRTQGVCYHLFGEMHACDLVPSITGNFLLRRRKASSGKERCG